MTLTELMNDIQQEEAVLSTRLDRCDVYAEAAFATYDINLKEAQLKVLTENGTDEDFAFLKEAAEESVTEKIGKTFSAIVESVKTFVTNVITKITTFLNDEKTKLAMKKAEKSANDGSLKDKKVMIPDTKAIEKAYAEESAAIDRVLSRLTAGANATDENGKSLVSATLQDAKSKREEKVSAASKATVAVTLVAAVAAISAIAANMKKTADARIASLGKAAANGDKKSRDYIYELKAAVQAKAGNIKGYTAHMSSTIQTIFKAIASGGKSTPLKDDDNLIYSHGDEVKESVEIPMTDEEQLQIEAALDELLATIEAEQKGADDGRTVTE